jgi:hypothetical protein
MSSVTVTANESGIAADGYFINGHPANRCPIENITLKLKTKSQIETRLPELKYSDANSRSINKPQLAANQCWQQGFHLFYGWFIIE